MKENSRLQALQILVTLLQEKKSLTTLLQKTTSPFTKELCFGVCRHYYRLEAIANLLMHKRPKHTDVLIIILIGLYQLHYLNQPDYAVVKETVELLQNVKKIWAKGLVNAVLRTYCREKAKICAQLQNDSMYKHGHPAWLLEKIRLAWPNNWEAILAANDAHPPMSLRINKLQTSINDYVQQLQNAQIIAHTHKYSSCGLQLSVPCDVQTLPDFFAGHACVQDEAAQLAVTLLDLQPQQRVLDACCAPGGKTCHILETEPRLAACIALDIDKQRLSRVQDNLQRLNLTATVIQGDALSPSSWWDGVQFDRILLDAPCSASGVIRRHPDIKLLRTAEEIAHIIKVQHAILRAMWPLLKPGGIIVYATCSIFPEENDDQISRFLLEVTDCKAIPIHATWGKQTTHGRQIFPGENNMDGFFYSQLRKTTL